MLILYSFMIIDEMNYCSNLPLKANNKVLDAWVKTNDRSNMNLSYFSLVKSKRAHLIIRQDGNLSAGASGRNRTGFWVGGVQHFSSMDLKLVKKGSSCKKYVRRPYYIYRKYNSLSRIDFIPPENKSIVIALQPHNSCKIELSIKIAHLKMWPLNKSPSGYKFMSRMKDQAIIESEITKTIIHLYGFMQSEIRYDHNTNNVIISGKIADLSTVVIGEDPIADTEVAFKKARDYFSKVTENCILESSIPGLDKAFLWAKISLLESYSETEAGNGFYAGFPRFSWFFGRDGLWASFAAYLIGLTPEADSNLDLLYRNSANGRIPHEIPILDSVDSWDQNYEVSGTEGINTKYMSIDSSLLWMIAQGYRNELSSKPVVEEEIRKVNSFITSLSTGTDYLLENNFSSGLIGWPETWATKRNGKCVDINAWYLEAVRVHDAIIKDHDGRFQAVYDSYKSRFLSGKFGLDSFTDSESRYIKTPLLAIPGIYFRLPRIKKLLRYLSADDLMTANGVRSMSFNDTLYDGGYHTGQIWPLMNGWIGLSAFNNGNRDLGERMLLTFIRYTFKSADPGRINETYDPDFFYPTGQFAQVWSSSLFIQLVIEGLLGFRHDWKHDMDSVNEIRMNSRSLNRIRIKSYKHADRLESLSFDKRTARNETRYNNLS